MHDHPSHSHAGHDHGGQTAAAGRGAAHDHDHHHHAHVRLAPRVAVPALGASHAVARPPAFSMLRLSLAERLAAAVFVSALIWLGVLWALS